MATVRVADMSTESFATAAELPTPVTGMRVQQLPGGLVAASPANSDQVNHVPASVAQHIGRRKGMLLMSS